MSTLPKKTNPNPVNTSAQGNGVLQNGTDNLLVIVICVSPTPIVDHKIALSMKLAGIVGGGVLVVIPIEFM